MERMIKRGDIFYAELNPVIGSEQGATQRSNPYALIFTLSFIDFIGFCVSFPSDFSVCMIF